MVEVLISSSVLILVLAILRLLLRGRISARLQYALWLLVLIRLLVPVSFFRSPVSVAEAAAPAVTRVQAAAETEVPVGTFTQDTAMRLIDLGLNPERSVVVSDASSERAHLTWFMSLRHSARLIWYAGMLLMAAWFLFVNLRMLQRLKRTRRPYEAAARPPVYLADDLPSPCLFGLFDPVIYLTEQAAADPLQARMIVVHERTHLRHGDLVWALLRGVCLVVWWFDPLVWLAAALSRQDAELACDEGTIRALGEASRYDYGRTLVGMAKAGRGTPSDLLRGATTMTGGRRSLRARVARIAKAPRVSSFLVGMTLAVAAIAACCTYAGAAERPMPAEPEAAAEIPDELRDELDLMALRDPLEEDEDWSIMVPDYDYLEEVDRELADFAYPREVEVILAPYYAPPDADPWTLEDLIYGTDSWQFRYHGEVPANDPEAVILVRSADDRTLFIQDDIDALLIEEADGSHTWVDLPGGGLTGGEMIGHLLAWAEAFSDPEAQTDALQARQDEAEQQLLDALAELGDYGLPDREPAARFGGDEYPLWIEGETYPLTAETADPSAPHGPFVLNAYSLEETLDADLEYRRLYDYEDGERRDSITAGELPRLSEYYSAFTQVTPVTVGGNNGIITLVDNHAPELIWYDAENDLLFSLSIWGRDVSSGELIALADSVVRS